MTTGEPLVVRVAMKPISTLMRPLGTIDVRKGSSAEATFMADALRFDAMVACEFVCGNGWTGRDQGQREGCLFAAG